MRKKIPREEEDINKDGALATGLFYMWKSLKLSCRRQNNGRFLMDNIQLKPINLGHGANLTNLSSIGAPVGILKQ